MQAEIKQHEQIKVETVSKYPLRVTGLVLFNAFANAGVVDDAKLPTLALPRNPSSSHGSVGATLSQTLLALEATGPRLGSARSSAEVSIDFFGGASSNVYGYNSTAGLVRMRQSQMSLDWDKTTVQASFMEPLISPLSPTSYATVAQPALAGSGNLWTWSPQLRVEQRVPISDRQRIAFEAGLIDPPSPGYTSIQLDSPVEASRRPGYEGRVSYHVDGTGAITSPFVFGVGVYSSRQFYNSTTRVHSWAVTGDWQVPLSKWFELTGEIYRGRALGGLGGGAYKDTLTGTDVITGLTRMIGVDAVGGWSQLKVRLNSTFETNAMFGLDNALSRNFDGLILSSSSYPLQLYARSTTVVGNVIFRPKTYLILSPNIVGSSVGATPAQPTSRMYLPLLRDISFDRRQATIPSSPSLASTTMMMKLINHCYVFVTTALSVILLTPFAGSQTVDVSARIVLSSQQEHARSSHLSSANVIIWLTSTQKNPPASPLHKTEQYALIQKGKKFSPHVLVVPTGSSVDFPNLDPFFHNVFSLF